nr:hypothetical protein [Tanacetum cinerariifolium]
MLCVEWVKDTTQDGHEAYAEHIRLSQCPKKFNKPPQLREKTRD